MQTKTNNILKELLKLHPKYIDLSLDRLKKLLHKLGDPHLDLPKTIHIAGTNGKGSIQSFTRKILVNNGYTCDAYISPHLTRFNERIVINNKDVSTKKLYETLLFVKKINNNNPITFFEITTAVAFFLFQRSASDFLILETGLGGRLDATNIIPKKLFSIITPISYDHEEFLGNTIQKITKEKLGIIKNSKFIIVSKQKREVNKFIKSKLENSKNIFFYGKDYKVFDVDNDNFRFKFKNENLIIKRPRLNGLHQVENASVALALSIILKQSKFKINFRKLESAIRNTVWPGRLEILKYKNKSIILDGSHNIDGAKKLQEFLKIKKIKPIVIFGMLNNKKLNYFLKIIKNQVSKLLAIKIPDEENAYVTKQISESCKLNSIDCYELKSLNEAINYINRSDQKTFLFTGSLYLIGKIRVKFLY